MQVSVDAMRVVAQETELRLNIKTQETAEIENDSSRAQEAASTPDTQNQSMHAMITITTIHQLSYSSSFAACSVVDSMPANDTTDSSCADISYTAPTSEHTPAFWLALMSNLQLGEEKGNVMKLIGKAAKEKELKI